ncbi:MAG TPA: hypothetical protein V6C69_20610 [Trichormus sp.]|jgi:hypothetical protein
MTDRETYGRLKYSAACLLVAALALSGCKRQSQPPPAPPASAPDRVEIRPASTGERVRIHKLDQDGNEIQMQVQYLDDCTATVAYAADGSISQVDQSNPDGSRVCWKTVTTVGSTNNAASRVSFLDKNGTVTDQIEHSGSNEVETQIQNGKPFMRKAKTSSDNHYDVTFFASNGLFPRIRFVLSPDGIEGGALRMFFYDTNGLLSAGANGPDESVMVLSKYSAAGVELYRQHWRTKDQAGSQVDPPVLESVEELNAAGKVVKRLEPSKGLQPARGDLDAAAAIVVHEYDAAGLEIATRAPQPQELSELIEIPTPSLDQFVPYLTTLDITPIPAHLQALLEQK